MIAVVIRKTHDRIHVGDIHPLRIGSQRIERDAERRIQAGGEDLHLLGLAVGGDSAEHLDVAAIGFSQEEIAVGSGADDARIVQPGRILLDLETFGRLRPRILGTGDNLGPGCGRFRRIRCGKILRP